MKMLCLVLTLSFSITSLAGEMCPNICDSPYNLSDIPLHITHERLRDIDHDARAVRATCYSDGYSIQCHSLDSMRMTSLQVKVVTQLINQKY